MQNGKLDGIEINLFDYLSDRKYQNFKQNELTLRNASKSCLLTCIDCGSLLTYKHTELKTAHFAHRIGTLKDCEYSEYTKKQTERMRAAKKMLHECLTEKFPLVSPEVEKKIDNKFRSDLIFNFQNGGILAVDYVNSIDVIGMDQKNTYYRENGINNIWILDISNKRKIYKDEEDMDLVKRLILNETVNSVVLLLDTKTKTLTFITMVQIDDAVTRPFEITLKLSDLELAQTGKIMNKFEDQQLEFKMLEAKMLNDKKIQLKIETFGISDTSVIQDVDLDGFDLQQAFEELKTLDVSFKNARQILRFLMQDDIELSESMCKEMLTCTTRTLGKTGAGGLRGVLVDLEDVFRKLLNSKASKPKE
ncbi:MAG: hypothetical protein GT601_17490 [Acidaminobacter sp.]|uniref:competence protein CoiA family protein n=1 Tax=Acidaminobacter sp. TaxID=1872102 RepID=UPI00137ED996|nr:hypothetical protein [Acidaminobacter sp.]MZQ99463.1 hypothetical protein [Acidaminobacter sp.]